MPWTVRTFPVLSAWPARETRGVLPAAFAETYPELVTRGWVELRSPFASVVGEATRLGGVAVPTRPGDGPVSRIRTVPAYEAHPCSLSAVVGTGMMPLHTDGAVERRTPEIVVLAARDGGSAADTLLFAPVLGRLPRRLHDALRYGTFSVVGRGRPFLAHALEGSRVRYDPGCMAPLDAMARYASSWFAEVASEAQPYRWESGIALVVDNTRVLHGRTSLRYGEVRVLDRCMLHFRSDDHSVRP